MIKKILSTILVSALFVVFLVPQPAFAGGGAVDGVDPTGGSCGDWWDTCYGYSWQKYEVVSDISGGVMLHTTTNTGSPVSISTCAVGQTIYNYGFEVHHSGYYGYQVSTQRNKYGVQAPHASSARGAYPGSRATIQNYTVASGYASMDEAKTEFYKMYEYAKDHPDKGPYEGINTNVNFEDAWTNVGAFCFDPEVDNPDQAPTHYYPTEPPKPCGLNLPSSYTSSNASSGTTSVASVVRMLHRRRSRRSNVRLFLHFVRDGNKDSGYNVA